MKEPISFRYCYLYENGGVYVDADTFCNQPLDNFISYQDLIVGLEGYVDKIGAFKDSFLILKKKQTTNLLLFVIGQ